MTGFGVTLGPDRNQPRKTRGNTSALSVHHALHLRHQSHDRSTGHCLRNRLAQVIFVMTSRSQTTSEMSEHVFGMGGSNTSQIWTLVLAPWRSHPYMSWEDQMLCSWRAFKLKCVVGPALAAIAGTNEAFIACHGIQLAPKAPASPKLAHDSSRRTSMNRMAVRIQAGPNSTRSPCMPKPIRLRSARPCSTDSATTNLGNPASSTTVPRSVRNKRREKPHEPSRKQGGVVDHHADEAGSKAEAAPHPGLQHATTNTGRRRQIATPSRECAP